MKTISFWILIITGIITYSKFYNYKAIEEDIFIDGERILAGENPYSRILGGDMRHNNKYTTYLPLFYLACSLSQYAGLESYEEWLSAWRSFNLLIFVLISWLIFSQVYEKFGWVTGIFGGLFWQFNAFSLTVIKIAQLDFLAIFFVLLSLLYMQKNVKVSLILFGVSLAIKQIGIFLVPFYGFFCYEQVRDWKKTLFYCTVYIGLVPFLASLPFLIWDAEGFVRSILFSATRNHDTHFGIQTLDRVYQVSGIPAKIPMLVLMLIPSFLYHQGKINKYLACFLIFSVFTGFNSVTFRQYMVWPIVFIPLLMTEFSPDRAGREGTAG